MENDHQGQSEERDPYLGDEGARADPARTLETPVEHVDLDKALEVIQVVAGETDLERLIGAVMRLSLEYAGAERGLLIRPSDDAFRIEAEAVVSSDGVKVALRQVAVSTKEWPESILSRRYSRRTLYQFPR